MLPPTLFLIASLCLFKSALKVEDMDRLRGFKIESTYFLNQTKIRNSLRCLLGLKGTDMVFDVLGSWKKKIVDAILFLLWTLMEIICMTSCPIPYDLLLYQGSALNTENAVWTKCPF